MAVYAIGDIQGCYDEFRRLLDQLDFSPGADRLWLTGDLVNRGPGSLATLRFVRELGEHAITVLGNHDLHLLAVAAGREPRAGDTLAPILAAPDRDELLAWLAGRPLLHEDPLLRFSMVHAGLPPQWDMARARIEARAVEGALVEAPAAFLSAMYGDEPDRWLPGLRGVDRLRFAVNCFTRLRYCTNDGRLLLKLKGPPESAPAGAVPWYAATQRLTRGERIVFGHWSALGYRVAIDTYSLDTGCVWGGSLTAIRLDGPRPGPPVSVRGTAAVAIDATE